REPLPVTDPVVSAIGGFFVRRVAGLGEIQRLYGGKPRAVAIATLIREIAAKVFEAAPLFGRDGRAVDNKFRPSRCCFHPFDELPRMLAPFWIFLRMQ